MPKSAFGFLQPEDSPGFLLWQVTVSWQKVIKAVLEPYEITHPQFVIMALLLWFKEQGVEPIQSMLIEKSKLDKMTVSISIKNLVEFGFLERKESREDTRAKSVKLTVKGTALIKKIIASVEQVDEVFFSKLKSDERKKLMLLLGKMA